MHYCIIYYPASVISHSCSILNIKVSHLKWKHFCDEEEVEVEEEDEDEGEARL